MIAFTLIGGYLGAGKTTLLNRILKAQQTSRVALVINDFGELNIDAELVESETENQINLTNGCVCCSMSDGFHDAMLQLQALEPPPQHIIVEASGVADVGNLAQYGRAPGFELEAVLVVADAETLIEKARDKYVGATVRRQLGCGDLILLNKADLLTPEALADRRQWLANEFPGARVIETVQANFPLQVLLGLDHETEADSSFHRHESYSTWSYTKPGVVTEAALEQFVSALPEFVIRAKGVVATSNATHRVQVVGERKEIDLIDAGADVSAGSVKLIAIGLEHQFDAAVLDQLAAECFAAPT